MMQIRIKLDEKIADFMDSGDETLTNIPKDACLSFDETNLNSQNLMEKVVEVFNLPKDAFESFGLVFDGFKHKNASSPEVFPIFLTEDSMKNIKVGSILLLTSSAKKYSQKYLSKLENINLEEDSVCNEFLDDLLVLVTDPCFLMEFQKLDGIKKLFGKIPVFASKIKVLCRYFCVFMEIMKNPTCDLQTLAWLSKLLPDIIAANEQLLNQNDHSCEKQYLELLERLPRSVIFREFLIINGGFKLEKKDAPPKWLIESISSRLTNYLLQKNGLFHLFLAFDDLGGDSFWQNSVALSSVAKLLSTKPKQSESYPKYLNFIFGEFLEIMKDNKFGSKISLLFALTITQLYSIDPLLVEIQLVDKLIRPWELLLERGLLNLKTKKYGLWNQNLDSSLIILKSWLISITTETYISKQFKKISKRFLKILPFLIYFIGQTSKIENFNTNFTKDVSFICMKIFGKELLTNSTKLLEILLNFEKETYGYFEIQKFKELNDENDGDGDSKQRLNLNYEIYLTILDETKDEEILLDYKIDGLKLILKQFNDELFSSKIMVLLMNECLKIWLNQKENHFINVKDDDVRFVPELENLLNYKTKKFPTIYIMVNIADYFLNLKIDYDDEIFNDMLKIAETIFTSTNEKLKELEEFDEITNDMEEILELESKTISLAIGLIGGILTNATENMEIKQNLQKIGKLMNNFTNLIRKTKNEKIHEYYDSINENCQLLLELFKNDLKLLDENGEFIVKNDGNLKKSTKIIKKTKFEEWKELLDDEDESIKGSTLIEISKYLRLKNKEIFKNENDFEWVWKNANEQAIHSDSYVFLASINVLAELVYWKSEPYLQRLIDNFIKWNNDTELSTTDLTLCCKIGEVLAKIFRQSGDFSTIYFDLFSNSLLNMTKSKDELMRSSALSSLADLIIATKGRKFSTILNEILYMISQYLKTDDSALVRRSSIHLLRCLISSADENLLITFGDTLRDIYRLLRHLWLNDRDETVRFHAELALIDLKKIMNKLISNLS